ncbi:MAG: DNA-binding protein WhiA [Bacilli bacterium]|nr:DNA-binding protein WhiA [Bacilli bacterium]
MSYTTRIKEEIATISSTKSEMIAELSGFIRNNGTLSDDTIILTTENESTKNRVEKFLQDAYEVESIVEIKDSLNFSKKDLYVININDKLDLILKDIGYIDEEGRLLSSPPNYIVGANEEIRAYLRGVFLSCGSINDPKTSRYHMELLIFSPDEAVFVQKLLNIFDLNAKILNRDKGFMIYIKEAEKISDYIKILGANKAVLYYEEVRIYRDQKNKTNRLNNCEQANMDRVFATANEQLKQIDIIESTGSIELLDDRTQVALEYRKKYPESSIQELAEIISVETGKSITKSGLNHRLRKIKELAERLKKNQEKK